MQCSKQRSESKVTVFSLNRMRGSCFRSHSRPSTTGYWPSLVTNSSRVSTCVLKVKEMRTVCVMAPEEMVLPSATVRSRGCCIGISFNPCSCANVESMNKAVAPQSAIAKVLNNEVSLLAMVHGNTMWSHFVLATSALADIDNSSLIGLRERLYSETVCFPTLLLCWTVLLCSTIMPLSSRECQLHGVWLVVC